MKVAISVPEPIFEAGERAAKRLKISRSKLYSRALGEYVRRHGRDDVTQRLNEVYRNAPSEPDPLIEALSLEVLRREKW